MAPTKVWAKGVSSSEMNVTWEPVQQDMNGILLGYEVSTLGPGRFQGRSGAPHSSPVIPSWVTHLLAWQTAPGLCSTLNAALAKPPRLVLTGEGRPWSEGEASPSTGSCRRLGEEGQVLGGAWPVPSMPGPS